MKKKITITNTTSKFKQAVENTEEIKDGYKNGLKALGNYSSKIQLGDTKKCDGSVDIDECTKSIYPQENRWDYALSYKDNVYFVEVHGADTSEVSVVLKKLAWLKDWVNTKAPHIKALLSKENPYIWIQTNGNHILPNSSQNRLIAQNGLKPIAKLKLD
jgi:hypothetical protein